MTASKVTVRLEFRRVRFGSQVEKVQFGDGTVWDTTLLAKASRSGSVSGNTSPETIYGVYNADDYYLFGRGDGNDVIVDNQNGFNATTGDTLTFRSGIAPSRSEERRVGKAGRSRVSANR